MFAVLLAEFSKSDAFTYGGSTAIILGVLSAIWRLWLRDFIDSKFSGGDAVVSQVGFSTKEIEDAYEIAMSIRSFVEASRNVKLSVPYDGFVRELWNMKYQPPKPPEPITFDPPAPTPSPAVVPTPAPVVPTPDPVTPDATT